MTGSFLSTKFLAFVHFAVLVNNTPWALTWPMSGFDLHKLHVTVWLDSQ